MASTEKLPQFTTPPGILKWPRLIVPDTHFDKRGIYSVGLILSEEEAAPLIEKLKPLHELAVEEGREKYDALPPAKRKKHPFNVHDFYTPVYDEDENETGEVEFKFKTYASGVSKRTGKKWTKKVALFDAKGKPITSKTIRIGGGSVGRVAFEVSRFWNAASLVAGLSLRLNAVKILRLHEGGERTAASYGFGDEEEGFSYSPNDFPEDDSPEDDENEEDNNTNDAGEEEDDDF